MQSLLVFVTSVLNCYTLFTELTHVHLTASLYSCLLVSEDGHSPFSLASWCWSINETHRHGCFCLIMQASMGSLLMWLWSFRSRSTPQVSCITCTCRPSLIISKTVFVYSLYIKNAPPPSSPLHPPFHPLSSSLFPFSSEKGKPLYQPTPAHCLIFLNSNYFLISLFSWFFSP